MFLFLKIDLKTSIALQSYFAANIQISESLFINPFKPVETFTIIKFWKAVLSRIPYLREELKDIESWPGKLITPGVVREQTVSKPSSWQSSTWLVDNGNKGPTKFYYFDLPGRAISTKKWNNYGNKKENLYLTFLHCCSSVPSWLWENNPFKPFIKVVARWLLRRENTVVGSWPTTLLEGGVRGVDLVVLEYTYFSRSVKVIIGILQPFSCFFYH